MLERQFNPTQTAEFKRTDQTRQAELLPLSITEVQAVLKPMAKEEQAFISPFNTAALKQKGLEQAYFFWRRVEAQLQKHHHESEIQSVSPKILAAMLN